jgi:hypothetical protein
LALQDSASAVSSLHSSFPPPPPPFYQPIIVCQLAPLFGCRREQELYRRKGGISCLYYIYVPNLIPPIHPSTLYFKERIFHEKIFKFCTFIEHFHEKSFLSLVHKTVKNFSIKYTFRFNRTVLY